MESTNADTEPAGDDADALLEGAADDFFGGAGDEAADGGGSGAGADADAGAAAAAAAAGEDEPFPLRRLRPLVREREELDGNAYADAVADADADADGGGSGGGGSAAAPGEQQVAARSAELAAASKEEGNRLFAARDFEAAAACYTEALRRCPRGADGAAEAALAPQRAVFYCNRAACALALVPPRHEDAIYDCDRALELRPDYAKALARRAASLEATGALDEALRDLQALAAIDPRDQRAASEAARVLALTSERDEKLKAEMLDKLKGLGNSLLGNFGLSLDNFKAVQGPDGAYSISFSR